MPLNFSWKLVPKALLRNCLFSVLKIVKFLGIHIHVKCVTKDLMIFSVLLGPRTTLKINAKGHKNSDTRWFLSHLLVAGCNIGVWFSVRQSVRPSVRQSVRLSTFMSTFDIYVKVIILINYKTKQPSNLAWNISLTSWLCDIGVRFSICLSICPSVCQHLCRSSTFMSKLVF